MTSKIRKRCWFVTCLALLCLWSTTALADATSVRTVGELPRLANRGEFKQLLALLESDLDVASDQEVADLITDLSRQQQHEQDRQSQQHDAYTTAINQMAKRIAEGNIEDALLSAIEAHEFALEPEFMLRDPSIEALAVHVQTAAEQAAETGQWLTAMSLYRGLEALFQDHARYRERARNVARHIRLLRFYAPRAYEEQLQQRAAGPTNQEDQPVIVDRETWREKLKGIEQSMLLQTLHHTALKHVSDCGFRPLLVGAINAITILLDTPGLEDTFASLDDDQKVREFREDLLALQGSIEQRTNKLGFGEVERLVDRIVKFNAMTVNLPEQVMIFELVDGALATLDDFTAVIWPREKTRFSRNTQGKFYGIGIQIARRNGRLIVVSPLMDTPAQRAGIKPADIIAEVDDRDTSTWTLDQAVRNITGPEGTIVNLGIERVGQKVLIEVPIKRAEIVIQSVRGWALQNDGSWDYYIDRGHRIGYVRISQFIPQTDSDLTDAIQTMQLAHGLSALIVDLRWNPGGLLSSAVEISDRFIDSGPIVYTEGSVGRRRSIPRARRHGTYPAMPLVILINHASASASEIVAGAVQDHGQGESWWEKPLVIGTRSFGKGSVQDLFPLSSRKAFLKLTTQYYKLPLGRIIHRNPDSAQWGIEPDLVVTMTAKQIVDAIQIRQELDILRDENDQVAPDDDPDAAALTEQDILDRGLDPQLQAGLLVLKSRLVAHRLAQVHGMRAMANVP